MGNIHYIHSPVQRAFYKIHEGRGFEIASYNEGNLGITNYVDGGYCKICSWDLLFDYKNKFKVEVVTKGKFEKMKKIIEKQMSKIGLRNY